MTSIDLVAVIRRIFAIIRRRIGLIIVPMLILVPGSFVIYKLLPRTYKSFTKILLVEPKIKQTLFAQVGNQNRLKKRINLLINVLLSQKILGKLAQHIAKKNGVTLTTRMRYEWAASLRGNVSIWSVGQGIVQLEYKCSKRAECLDHITYLFRLFLEESARPEKVSIKRSAKFLSKQLERLKLRLSRSENALTQFKRKYSMVLPKTFQASMSKYLATSTKLFEDRQELESIRRRRNFLRKQLNLLDPSLVNLRKQIIKMLQLKIRLANSLSRYTKRHPKIRRLSQRLNRLKKAIASSKVRKLSTLKQLQRSLQLGRFIPSANRDEFNQERKGPLALFDKYQDCEIRIQVLSSRIQSNQALYKKLKKKLTGYPLREQQLTELKRDAQIARTIYTKVRTLHEQSLLQRELDTFDSSRRVRVIEPAVLPLYPISPKFIIIVGGGIFAALALSGLLIAFAELFDPTFTDDEDATNIFSVDVIGEVRDLEEVEL